MKRLIRCLGSDERGATIIEFALIAPTFLLMLIGSFDVAYQVYLRATLSGAVQAAARASALESGPSSLEAIDKKVEEQVQSMAPNAVVEAKRKSYLSYNDIGRAEAFADENGNDICDNNESYEDENNNGKWDRDLGKSGVGGARDVVQYDVSVTYDQLFPLWKMVGGKQRVTITSTTVLKNQPYKQQEGNTAVARTCT